MDPVLQELLKEGGKTVLATPIGACIKKLLSPRKNKKLTTQEKAQVKPEKMIQAATMGDIRAFSPTYRRVSSAAKKAPPKRRIAFKRAASKQVTSRKSAATAAERSAPRGRCSL